jgi:cell division protein ZipA
VLEIFVITIALFVVFIAVAWFAHIRSKKVSQLLDLDGEPTNDAADENYTGDSFDALYEQELKQQQPQHSRDIHSEPTISLSAAAQTANITTEPVLNAAVTATESTKQQTEMKLDASPEQDWEMIVSFTVLAMPGEQFSGRAVKSTLDTLDMHFGEMQLFHRYTAGMQKQNLFSVANIIDPGTLIPDSFATMNTPGLLIFAQLPGPTNGLALFDDLLDTAQKMAATLGGILSDEKREPVDDAKIEEMRSRILSLNLRLQAESNQ